MVAYLAAVMTTLSSWRDLRVHGENAGATRRRPRVGSSATLTNNCPRVGKVHVLKQSLYTLHGREHGLMSFEVKA